jgi:hypothetical protein
VETDLGEGYIKALGNPEGPHTLACEYVGSVLANWLGLPTFDFSIVNLNDDDDIPFRRGGKAKPGPAFISRAEPLGFPWGGTETELRRVVNHFGISGLVAADTWVLNCDRYAPDGRRKNLENVFLIQRAAQERDLILIAMDFTHAFTCGGEINRRIGFIERCKDPNVYGLFPEFRRFLDRDEVRRLAGRMGDFPKTFADELVRSVPTAWEVDRESRNAWSTMISERAHFLADNLEQMLWPQLELDGGTE